jgi:hypothetical protein
MRWDRATHQIRISAFEVIDDMAQGGGRFIGGKAVRVVLRADVPSHPFRCCNVGTALDSDGEGFQPPRR